MYNASYNCHAGKLSLKYDGPGSNYEVGGFSRFYVGSKVKVLAANSDEGSKNVGYEVGQEKIGITFEIVKARPIGRPRTQSLKGHRCEPGDIDYDHTDSRASYTVQIKDISSEAQPLTGLKPGQVLTLSCSETQDMPVVCGDNGRY